MRTTCGEPGSAVPARHTLARNVAVAPPETSKRMRSTSPAAKVSPGTVATAPSVASVPLTCRVTYSRTLPSGMTRIRKL